MLTKYALLLISTVCIMDIGPVHAGFHIHSYLKIEETRPTVHLSKKLKTIFQFITIFYNNYKTPLRIGLNDLKVFVAYMIVFSYY